MTRIAFLTMDSLDGFVSYDHLVKEDLERRGIAVDEVSWRANGVDWNQYQLVVIRSPWDYQQECGAFLDVLAKIDRSTTCLENPLQLVRWNVEKTYLRDLQDAGITIVPTRWIDSPDASELRSMFTEWNTDAIVIKPVIGAGAENAFWLRPDCSEAVLQHVEQIYRGQVGLIQPFVDSVTAFGELSLIYFSGVYSHSVLKKPRSGDFRVQEEHGGEIQPCQPPDAALQTASRILQSIPHKTLYARIDLVMLTDGNPAVMEVELIEPSLYLSFCDGAATRFADAIAHKIATH